MGTTELVSGMSSGLRKSPVSSSKIIILTTGVVIKAPLLLVRFFLRAGGAHALAASGLDLLYVENGLVGLKTCVRCYGRFENMLDNNGYQSRGFLIQGFRRSSALALERGKCLCSNVLHNTCLN